jgi:hypothetical protein
MPSNAFSELRKSFILLIAAIAVVDGIVIGLYYALHVAERPVKTQETFVGVWVALTLLVLTTGMKRIRQARRALRESGRDSSGR